MALSEFQSSILRQLAHNRRTAKGSCVAGGLALNHSLGTPRLSRDIGEVSWEQGGSVVDVGSVPMRGNRNSDGW